MENAAEALKIAAWVLIFVTALSITINSFSQARESSDAIVTNIDREYITTWVEESKSTKRRVGAESIVPAIYRSIYYNFKIVFPNGYNLYTKINSFGEEEPVNYIDLETGASLSKDTKELFIYYILYGEVTRESDQRELAQKLSISYDDFKKINNTLHQDNKFNAEGLYNKIKYEKFEEDVGVYYQEETEGGNDSPNVNKTEKRVITYTEIN
ncbi:MAG: hypothetical protein IJH76_03595 [Clostridia bacterium]|nr:hypothetical protein [Clostridia bacterium]